MPHAWLVEFFDRNKGRDRTLVFCSPACIAATLAEAPPAKRMRVPMSLAGGIECHGCGFTLDTQNA